MAALTDLEKKVVGNVQNKNVSFGKSSFASDVEDSINEIYYHQSEGNNVDTSFKKFSKKYEITPEEKEMLVNLQKSSPYIKEDAEKFLPIALLNIRNKKLDYSSLSSTDGGTLDPSIEEYFSNVSRMGGAFEKVNVQFAGQLYYVKVMCDELEIMNAADTLMTKYLLPRKDIRSNSRDYAREYVVDVRSKATMDAIRLYAFADRFEDIKTGDHYQRSQEPERMMFYQNVFDERFNNYWETLMVEAAKYIEKAEKNISYENVSRNNVYQAIEDLQYYLSQSCTGLVKISSNVINMELDFIMKRLFADKDIKEQIGRRDRTEMGVLTQILSTINNDRGMDVQNITALYNKALLGNKIINEIANYTPDYMEVGNNWGRFISYCQSNIVTMTILQGESDTGNKSWDEEPSNYRRSQTPVGAGGDDDWNF